jgi:hypothetical protein
MNLKEESYYSKLQQSVKHKPLLNNEENDNEDKDKEIIKTFEKTFDNKLFIENIEGLTIKEKPCFIIKNVLTQEECKLLIKYSEKRVILFYNNK